MRKQRFAETGSVVLGLLVLAASSARAQSAREIIDRHVRALGGAKALKSVASVRLSGTVKETGTFLWQTKAPNAYSLEIRHADTHLLEGFNGKSAWRQDGAAGPRTLTGADQARARDTGAYRSGRFLTDKKDKTRVALLGREAVLGRAAYAVLVTPASGIRRKVFFDAQTYFILKEEQDGELEEIFFDDYRALDGVQEPHRIRIRRGIEILELSVQKAEHNVALEDAAFDAPRRDRAPLPDLAELFKQVLDNQNKVDKARENCAYTRTETETSGKGHAERVYDGFYAYGRPVEQLVSRNGQPLTPAEAAKESERVAKVIRERAAAAQKKAGRERAKAEKEEDDEDVTVAGILRVCRLVNPRREPFRGREALIFDFEARPGEKPRRRVESILRDLVGSVWIDEDAKRLLRLEARVNDSIKIAGGLVASVRPGSSMVFEQELIKGEVWLPTYAEVNVIGRFLLVKGVQSRTTERFSDYKTFGTETSSEIQLPKP